MPFAILAGGRSIRCQMPTSQRSKGKEPTGALSSACGPTYECGSTGRSSTVAAFRSRRRFRSWLSKVELKLRWKEEIKSGRERGGIGRNWQRAIHHVPCSFDARIITTFFPIPFLPPPPPPPHLLVCSNSDEHQK